MEGGKVERNLKICWVGSRGDGAVKGARNTEKHRHAREARSKLVVPLITVLYERSVFVTLCSMSPRYFFDISIFLILDIGKCS